MDILLSHGFSLAHDPVERRVMRPYPPLGILYLSAFLKQRGMDVRVFDTTFETLEGFDTLVGRERPPVVGLYANLLTRPRVLQMMHMARRHGAHLVLGGPDPSVYPQEYLERGADAVVIGEGEQTLAELLPALHDGDRRRLTDIPGIVTRDVEGRIVRTKARPFLGNLDDLPWPDRSAIDIKQYVDVWRAHHGLGSVSLITARGCPYTCTWCSHSVFGYSHRRRSPANVATELESIVGTYRPDMVWYADDVFTIHHKWLRDYAAEVRRRRLRVPFETISREDRLNDEVIATLGQMGCQRLWIGSESGSQRVMDGMQRGADVLRIREMVRLLQKYGIEAGLFVMLGYDGEEDEDLEATCEHLKLTGADRFLTTVAYPINGTPYFNRVRDRVSSEKPWGQTSDREFTIAGRRSRAYYRHATRWLVNDVANYQERQRPRPDWWRVAGTFARARLGRLGMYLTRHQSTPSACAVPPPQTDMEVSVSAPGEPT